MDSVSKELIEIYTAATRAPPDMRVINAWSRAINNRTKLLSDFVSSLIARPDYRAAVATRYHAIAKQLMPTDHDEVVCDANVDSLLAQHAGAIVRDVDIDAHVRSLPPFRQKQTDVVRHIVRLVLPGRESDDGLVGPLVQRFLQPGSTYDLDQLHADLQQINGSGVPGPPAHSADGPGTPEVAPSGDPRPDDGVPEVNPATPRAPAVDMAELSAALERFEEAFGRKMFVEEYVHYTESSEDVLGMTQTQLREFQASFQHAYDAVREVYLAFADERDFSQYTFVRRHLAEYQEPGFIDALPDRLMALDAYGSMMRARLSSLYSETYDDALDASSLEYLLARVQGLRLGLNDAGLIKCIREFKDETDAVVENVYYVYMAAYARSPEEPELRGHVAEYRARITKDQRAESLAQAAESLVKDAIEAVNAEVTIRLISALEFHDVIKGKLRARFGARFGSRTPSPTTLYQGLEAVIAVLPSCHTLQHVDDAVERFIDARPSSC